MGASAFKDVSQVGERVDASIVRSWQTRLRKLFKLANVPNGHAHRFRDTFAVELLLAGVPIERVSVLLGHQSVRITEKHYAPWVRSRQEQLEADLARAWSRDPLVLSQGEVHTRGTLEGDDSETSSISTGNTGTRRGSRAHGVRVISILPFEFCKPRAQAPLPIVPLRDS